MTSDNCQICLQEKFKYTCPRCNIIYCSVACYKSQKHVSCSEQFYKQCVQDELTATDSAKSNEEMRKIYDILKRIREADAGMESENFEDNLDDGLNSDDDGEVEDPANSDDELENDVDDDDICERLKDIDINDADEVWDRLNESEKQEFKKLLETGEILKLMPDYKPWWLKQQTPKIVDITKSDTTSTICIPKIQENIPKYSSLCSKEPAPCLHYNLWNILSAYACTVRFFNGEHLTNPNEASAHLVNLSSTLKYGTNFEDVQDAIISVEMEALTTGNGATQLMPTGAPNSLLVENREQLKDDVRNLMSSRLNKLAALSDVHCLLQLTKQILKKSSKGDAEFQKLFALSSGMEELTKTKISQLIKKLEFYIAYVNREAESDLK